MTNQPKFLEDEALAEFINCPCCIKDALAKAKMIIMDTGTGGEHRFHKREGVWRYENKEYTDEEFCLILRFLFDLRCFWKVVIDEEVMFIEWICD